MLFSLRTKTSKYFKSNFPNMEKSCLHCPLRCWGVDEVPILDTQEHILLCKRLSNLKSSEVTTEKVEYSFLFGEIKKQKEIVTLIILLLEEKQILCPPGDKLDPSTVQGLCCSSNWFWYYICYYLGFKNKKNQFDENLFWWWKNFHMLTIIQLDEKSPLWLTILFNKMKIDQFDENSYMRWKLIYVIKTKQSDETSSLWKRYFNVMKTHLIDKNSSMK